MTKKETAEIISIMQVAYPDSFKNKSESMIATTVNLWQMCFADEPSNIVTAAVISLITGSADAFMPSIGRVKERIQEMQRTDELDETAALARIVQACRNGYYSSQSEFERLPPVLQQIVGSPAQLKSWSQMDENVLQSVVGSALMRSYRSAKARQESLDRLPSSTKNFISSLADGLKMPEKIMQNSLEENEKCQITQGS